MHPSLSATLPILLLAACTGTTGDQIEMTRLSNLPETATGETHPVGIWTYLSPIPESANAPREEITGVPCEVKGEGFEASFTTPGVLALPVFRDSAPDAFLSCTQFGRTITKPLVPADLRSQARKRAASSQVGMGNNPIGSMAIGWAFVIGDSNKTYRSISYNPTGIGFKATMKTEEK